MSSLRLRPPRSQRAHADADALKKTQRRLQTLEEMTGGSAGDAARRMAEVDAAKATLRGGVGPGGPLGGRWLGAMFGVTAFLSSFLIWYVHGALA